MKLSVLSLLDFFVNAFNLGNAILLCLGVMSDSEEIWTVLWCMFVCIPIVVKPTALGTAVRGGILLVKLEETVNKNSDWSNKYIDCWGEFTVSKPESLCLFQWLWNVRKIITHCPYAHEVKIMAQQ